jgi:hypothetical protein
MEQPFIMGGEANEKELIAASPDLTLICGGYFCWWFIELDPTSVPYPPGITNACLSKAFAKENTPVIYGTVRLT